MKSNPVGRPRKKNPKKPGQLKKGECRYTFITTKEIVDKIKKESKRENISIKNYMIKSLLYYWSRDTHSKLNEIKLINYQRKLNQHKS
jgi:hypothetical protein